MSRESQQQLAIAHLDSLEQVIAAGGRISFESAAIARSQQAGAVLLAGALGLVDQAEVDARLERGWKALRAARARDEARTLAALQEVA